MKAYVSALANDELKSARTQERKDYIHLVAKDYMDGFISAREACYLMTQPAAPTTCWVIMSEVNGYRNIEGDNVYTTREEAFKAREELTAQWNAKDAYYVLSMNLI